MLAAPTLEQKGKTMKLPRDFALLLATSFLEEGTHNNVKLWGLFFQNPLDGLRYLFLGTLTCYCAVNMTNKSHQEEPLSFLFKIKEHTW